MENPNEQWMRTGGTPLRKPPILFLSSRHWLEEILHHLGWLKPYYGMFTTYQLVQHFGKPSTGIHRSWVNISWLIISLQFESRWFSHVTQVKNIPQFYFHPFVSFILPGSMLIILSCLLITGGELVALGEAAEDQVRHQNILGDPWWNVWKKTSENHRKTHRKNGENHCLWEIPGPILMVLLSLYLSTYLNHPSLENHISSSQFLFDAIHFNRKRCGGQRAMPQSTCLDQSVYLLGRDILHVGPRIRSFVLVTWWFS